MASFYVLTPTVQANPQHCVSFDPRLFFPSSNRWWHRFLSWRWAHQRDQTLSQICSDISAFDLACLSHLNFITSPRWARYLAKSNSVYSAAAFFAYSSLLFMVYWAGHFPCLLEQLLQWWPLFFFLTGVGRLLVCCLLSSSLLRVRPASDLLHSLYWDHMNNLFFEFSPNLTFRCLIPTGFGFNNIDSAPFLCASSDKVWKHSLCTWYQNQWISGMLYVPHTEFLHSINS